jgi:adenylylsulfate kinase
MLTLWFMGRPASGKSTLAAQVENELVERGYPIENLDGDEIRKNLHPELGFSKEDRGINNRRTAFIAKLLNRNGINTIVAMITPFRESQQRAREIIEENGDFVLIYVKAPLEECVRRDPKRMYQQAKAGKIENFTGVSHPFQEPVNPDIVVESSTESVDESVNHIMRKLDELGFLEESLEDQYRFSITRSQRESIIDDLREGGYID